MEHPTLTAPQTESLSRRLVRTFARPAAMLLRHPATTVALGIGLFAVGIIEILEGIFDDFESVIASHHGFLLFGFVTILRGLMELLEASEFFSLNEAELEALETEDATHPSDPPSCGPPNP